MLTVNNLCKTYQTGKLTYEVLKGVSFSVEAGEFVGVMGSSGSGKTTLLNCISCYIPFEKGSIQLGGEDISGLTGAELARVRNQKLGFVFQDFMLLDGLNIRENIMLPRIISQRVDKDMEKSAEILGKTFGISHIMDKYPAEVSGGERQRTAVARALMNQPMMILADEPTGNLDSKSSRAVIDSFIEAKETMDATIFMVTHDSFAASFCDKVIILKDGKVRKILINSGGRREFQDSLLESIREMGGEEA